MTWYSVDENKSCKHDSCSWLTESLIYNILTYWFILYCTFLHFTIQKKYATNTYQTHKQLHFYNLLLPLCGLTHHIWMYGWSLI